MDAGVSNTDFPSHMKLSRVVLLLWEAPLLHTHGVVTPQGMKTGRTQSHTSSFSCIAAPGSPNMKIHLKLSEAFAELQLRLACKLHSVQGRNLQHIY